MVRVEDSIKNFESIFCLIVCEKEKQIKYQFKWFIHWK